MQDLKSLGDTQEIKIGNREVALLMGALFVVLVVVFGLGVMVGKRIYEQPAGIATRPATAEVPIASLPATTPINAPEPAQNTAQPPATGENLTFLNELGGKKPETAVATSEKPKPQPPPAATHETPAQEAATPVKPAEQPKPQPAATAKPTPPVKPQPPAAGKPAEPAKPQPPATTAQPATKPKPQPAAAAAQPAAAKPTPKPTTAPSGAASKPTSIPSDWKWSIQVAAVSNKENADRYVGELKKKGLDAWLFKVTPATGVPLFVVRVGHYKSVEEAKKALESNKASGLIPDESIIRVKQ